MIKSIHELKNLIKHCEESILIYEKQLESENNPDNIKKIKTKMVKTKKVLNNSKKELNTIEEENI